MNLRKPSDRELRTLEALHGAGATDFRLRGTLGVTPKVLEYWLSLANLEPPAKKVYKRTALLTLPESVKFKCFFFHGQPSIKEAAEHFDVSSKTIGTWLVQLGIEPHTPTGRSYASEIKRKTLQPLVLNSPKIVPEHRCSIADRFRPMGLATFKHGQ
jgi:hypothetical protein